MKIKKLIKNRKIWKIRKSKKSWKSKKIKKNKNWVGDEQQNG